MLKTISNKRKIDRTTFITNARRDWELWSLSMHELTNRWVRNQEGMRETVAKTYNHGTRCCLLARRGRRTEISWLQLLFPRVFLRSLFSTQTQKRRAKAEEEEHLLLLPPLRSQQRSRGQGTQGNKCAHGEEGSQGGVPSEVPRGKGPNEAYLPRYQGGRVSRRRTFLRFQVPTEVAENGQSPWPLCQGVHI
jgi:hypothetical protein